MKPNDINFKDFSIELLRRFQEHKHKHSKQEETVTNCNYTSVDVAGRVLFIAKESNLKISELKLQQILWAVYGFSLAQSKALAFVDESPRVSSYGPVFLKVYEDNKDGLILPRVDKLTPELESLLTRVIITFKDWSASKMLNWSHNIGGAWDKAGGNDEQFLGKVIPNEFIVKEFKRYV